MREVVPRGGYIMSASEDIKDMAEALNKLIAQPERICKMSEVMIEHRNEVRVSERIVALEKIFTRLTYNLAKDGRSDKIKT